jgi:rubrerythrin
MGHSTVTIGKPGMLSSREITSAVQAQKEADRAEYGHHESPDSWTHAEDPKMTFLNRIYSEKAVRDLMDKEVNSYESYAFYYVDQKTWDELFRSKKTEKALEKQKEMIKKLNAQLESLVADSLKESGLEEMIKSSEADVEPKFWTCDHCKSKINMRMHYRARRQMPERCPSCGHSDAEILADWRQKLFGKAYLTKRQKLETAIEAAKKELQELNTEDVSSISTSELDKHKGLVKAVRTVIAADIHH